jgi:hypothetical protein
MCTRARPYGRVGRCAFGKRGVTNSIRADPRGCVYGSVCEHRVHNVWSSDGTHDMTYGSTLDIRSCTKREGS